LTFNGLCSVISQKIISFMFLPDLPFKVYAFLIFTMRATCGTQLILLDLITLTLSGGQNKLRSCSLSNFVHPSVALPVLGSDTVLSPSSIWFPPILITGSTNRHWYSRNQRVLQHKHGNVRIWCSHSSSYEEFHRITRHYIPGNL
jgi:hypothetical protein